jgi:lipopolysaccharide/colanic/teichoic acid biosynthesis glycosyltransferase
MSVVGPRPHPVAMRTQNRRGDEIIAEYAHRHRVKPGLTGWAQINGSRGATETAEQVRQRIEYDLYYIENWSILFDLKILLHTPYRLIVDSQKAY